MYGRFELDCGSEMGVEVVYADTAPETCLEQDVVGGGAFEATLQTSRGNRRLYEAFSSVMRFHNPAEPSVVIVSVMFEDRTWHNRFVSESNRRIAAAHEFATERL
ncbi:1-aminocyclopropane-1-carboxylate synthase [Colletotrichum graminicola]|uniref:1-aminocyclopropane-1-carboxylate synthase n=1 Tax=Colletotrichum graminicola (strain M1.001 / M2 / FGSC 10212) TaxID=645133 RepID=E3QVM5_COLGM|nr:1-aminocyclopropane-1-carboxylate synthase [Colletotrichum graminicola M1.001]EFQ34913.1 1-aminocyclopropane-1-carboxylate synthase [Colletotrichum graminicola M1.001]WDK12882.1 1-aminocyclopropane-1-carboxylate synthase [Colletotrichum graminicola]